MLSVLGHVNKLSRPFLYGTPFAALTLEPSLSISNDFLSRFPSALATLPPKLVNQMFDSYI